MSWEAAYLGPRLSLPLPHGETLERTLAHPVRPPCISTQRGSFLNADNGSCPLGDLETIGAAQWWGERRDRVGELLTTVSLIQAVGAILDPITGGHTESVHGAEELSRAGWMGRAPSGHTSL